MPHIQFVLGQLIFEYRSHDSVKVPRLKPETELTFPLHNIPSLCGTCLPPSKILASARCIYCVERRGSSSPLLSYILPFASNASLISFLSFLSSNGQASENDSANNLKYFFPPIIVPVIV